MLDVSPWAYMRMRPPPRTLSPTMTATAPRLWAQSTFSAKPHSPRFKRTTLPSISALSCNDCTSVSGPWSVSLQPSSPLARVSSLKPLPIHSALLRPFVGRPGPKAAGRARKKVELSSVRLMMAEGGKSEPGEVKDSNARKPFCVSDIDVCASWSPLGASSTV